MNSAAASNAAGTSLSTVTLQNLTSSDYNFTTSNNVQFTASIPSGVISSYDCTAWLDLVSLSCSWLFSVNSSSDFSNYSNVKLRLSDPQDSLRYVETSKSIERLTLKRVTSVGYNNDNNFKFNMMVYNDELYFKASDQNMYKTNGTSLYRFMTSIANSDAMYPSINDGQLFIVARNSVGYKSYRYNGSLFNQNSNYNGASHDYGNASPVISGDNFNYRLAFGATTGIIKHNGSSLTSATLPAGTTSLNLNYSVGAIEYKNNLI